MSVFDTIPTSDPMPSSGYSPVRGSLDPNDPNYLKKLALVGALEGHHELASQPPPPPTGTLGAINSAPSITRGSQPQVRRNSPGVLGEINTAPPSVNQAHPTVPARPDTSVAPAIQTGPRSAPTLLDVTGKPLPTGDADYIQGVAKPQQSTLGKIGHGLEVAGNIAGDVFAPESMALIPGTQLYKERIGNEQFKKNLAQEGAQAKTAEGQADLVKAQAEWLKTQNPNLDIKTTEPDVSGQVHVIGTDPRTGNVVSDSIIQAGVKSSAANQPATTGANATLNNAVAALPGLTDQQRQSFLTWPQGYKPTADDIKQRQAAIDTLARSQQTQSQQQFNNSMRQMSAQIERQNADLAQQRQSDTESTTSVQYLDPQTGLPTIGSEADAKAAGVKSYTKVSNTQPYEAVVTNVNLMDNAVGQFKRDVPLIDQISTADRTILQNVLNKVGDEGDPGSLRSLWDSTIASAQYQKLDDNAKQILMDVFNLRESSLGLGKLESGSSRMMQTAINAINRVEPGAFLTNSKDAAKQLDMFGNRLNTIKQNSPQVPGSGHTFENPPSYSVTAPNGKVYSFPNRKAADDFKKAAGIR